MSVIATLRDISIVILALEALFMLLVPGVILYFANKGMSWLIQQVRKYGPMARYYADQVAQKTEELSHRAAAPVIATSAGTARAERIRTSLVSSLLSTFRPRTSTKEVIP